MRVISTFVLSLLILSILAAASAPTVFGAAGDQKISHTHEGVCGRFAKSSHLTSLVSASMKYIQGTFINKKQQQQQQNNNNNKKDEESFMNLIMNIENSVCDVSCESQLCSCLSLDFDPISSSTSNKMNSFCKKPSSPNNNNNDGHRNDAVPSSETTTECLRNYKTCKETSLASAPEPHEGMTECNRAVSNLGFAINPETCANFVCDFAESHQHLLLAQSVLSTNLIDERKAALALDAVSACTNRKRKIAFSDFEQQHQQNGGGGKAQERNALALVDDPLSDMISELLSSVLSSVINSLNPNRPTSAPPTTTRRPTTTATSTTTTTTTLPPTTFAPRVAPNQQLTPGLVQVNFNYSRIDIARSELATAIDNYINSQRSNLAETVPQGADIAVVVDAVGGSQFQLSFVVTGVSSDAEASKLEAAVAQAVSDAINVKSYKSPDLIRVLSATGRAPVPGSSSSAAPQYPKLPDPLNPPPPKMEELPIGAVVGGILGGVIVGLAVGGLVAHYFCSKVEVLPLRDRLMPTGDDEDSDEEEEEEDEDENDGDMDRDDDDFSLPPPQGNYNNKNSSSNNNIRGRANSDLGLLPPTKSNGTRGGAVNPSGRHPQTDLELLNLANSSPKKNMPPASSSSPRNNNNNNNGVGSSSFSPRDGARTGSNRGGGSGSGSGGLGNSGSPRDAGASGRRSGGDSSVRKSSGRR